MGVVNFTLRALGFLFSAFLYSYLDVLDRQKVEEPVVQEEGLTITYTRILVAFTWLLLSVRVPKSMSFFFPVLAIGSLSLPFTSLMNIPHAMIVTYLVGAFAYWYTGGPFSTMMGPEDQVNFKPFEQEIRLFLYKHNPSQLHLVDSWLLGEYKGKGQQLLTKLHNEYNDRPATHVSTTQQQQPRTPSKGGPSHSLGPAARLSQAAAASPLSPQNQPIYAMNYPSVQPRNPSPFTGGSTSGYRQGSYQPTTGPSSGRYGLSPSESPERPPSRSTFGQNIPERSSRTIIAAATTTTTTGGTPNGRPVSSMVQQAALKYQQDIQQRMEERCRRLQSYR